MASCWLVIPYDKYNQLVIFPYNNRDLHVGNTWRNTWVGLSSPHCSRNSWENIFKSLRWKVKVNDDKNYVWKWKWLTKKVWKWKWLTTKSLKVIDDRHNVWKWKWLMWASTRTAQLLVKEVTIEPYTLIQCMIYTHFCIFGLWPWSPAWLPCIPWWWPCLPGWWSCTPAWWPGASSSPPRCPPPPPCPWSEDHLWLCCGKNIGDRREGW